MKHPLEHPRIAEFKKAQKALARGQLPDAGFALTPEDRQAIADMQTHAGCRSLIKALSLKQKMYLRQWYGASDEDFAQAIQLKARCSEIDQVIGLLTDKPTEKPKKEKDENAGG